jgi:pyruvate kinase
MLRRTKIVATVGPATDDLDIMDELIASGMDVARVNFSHGDFATHEQRVTNIRERARAQDRHVGIMVDLQGPKIRIEGFKQGSVELQDDQKFVFDIDLGAQDGDTHRVGITYKDLLNDVKPGDVLLLDDGNISMVVEKLLKNEIHCRVQSGGALSDHKGLNLQGGGLSAGALTKKDLEDIKFAARLEADYLAVSFVRNAEDVRQARWLLEAAGGRARIVAKVERADAIERIDEIMDASDVVMIARGDLGVEIGDAELPGVQKDIIRRARDGNCIVITATQMMQSMVEHPHPTRAEVLDVANAVMDGTDAVMLSAETAIGKYPVLVVQRMASICVGAERQRVTMVSSHRLDTEFETHEEAVAMAAMYTANHYDVRAIVAMTESGGTAKWMSRISSGLPIFAMSRQIGTLRRVTLYRGVYPIFFDIKDGQRGDEAQSDVLRELLRLGVVSKGDAVIVTQGELTGIIGGTNSMKILIV